MAVFGEGCAALPTVSIDIWRSQAATLTVGYLILIGAEPFKIISKPMGDVRRRVSAHEVVKVLTKQAVSDNQPSSR
jgi:hypothetical protein